MLANPQVIILGAGPVGIWTALQIKMGNPILQIKVIDKNYGIRNTREHNLQLDAKHCKMLELPEKQDKIAVNDLTQRLIKVAKANNIEFERNDVKNCVELRDSYPETKVFIGADGAQSLVRRQMFRELCRVDTNLENFVEVRYNVLGRAQTIYETGNYYAVAANQSTVVAEDLGRRTDAYDGLSPINIRFFIQPRLYEMLDQPSPHQYHSLSHIKYIAPG